MNSLKAVPVVKNISNLSFMAREPAMTPVPILVAGFLMIIMAGMARELRPPDATALSPIRVGNCVPCGSLIVIYNPLDLNPAVPADDPYDANGDHVYILPVTSALIEFNNSGTYTNTGFGPSPDWDGIVQNNTNDAVQTLDNDYCYR